MRRWLVAVAVCSVAACSSENPTGENSEPVPTAFDGGLAASDASAKAARQAAYGRARLHRLPWQEIRRQRLGG